MKSFFPSSFLVTILILVIGHSDAQSWKKYPLTLENNAELTFPEVEGAQYQYQGDSWFITAQVTGLDTGKKYQIVTIFSRNYITAAILNIYQTSIFDYGTGDFNTFTEYDLPGVDLAHMNFYASGKNLDLGFHSTAGNASWHNTRLPNNSIAPFEYRIRCPGTDKITKSPFGFDVIANMQKKPVAFGGSTLRGFFTFYKQQNTLTYFNTGPRISGTITFEGVIEKVRGTQGHIDRQIFPLYNGIFTPTGRQNSHEWRQINLDNGIDLAIWRQFDRLNNNTILATTGTTTSYNPNANGIAWEPSWHNGLPNDITVEYFSYAKYPRSQYSTLLPPPSPNMYHPSKHIIRSKALNMELTATYTTKAPVAELPIEYFEGPANWVGIYNGRQVTGVGIFETTLSLYRHWELAEVLLNSVVHLSRSDFAALQPRSMVVAKCRALQSMVSSNPLMDNRAGAGLYANKTVIPSLQTITNGGIRRQMIEIANDFVGALTILS